MDNKFLKLDKELLTREDITLLEKCIISQIVEFTNNNYECYMTDAQFAEAFGISVKKVTRAIKNLNDNGLITRNTHFVNGNGKGNRMRTLSININGMDKNVNGMDKGVYTKNNGMDKSEQWNGQNRNNGMDTSVQIKDKERDNKEIINAPDGAQGAGAPKAKAQKKKKTDKSTKSSVSNSTTLSDVLVTFNDLGIVNDEGNNVTENDINYYCGLYNNSCCRITYEDLINNKSYKSKDISDYFNSVCMKQMREDTIKKYEYIA